ncbi:MAG: carboxylating nicotinate-nucleotide diphosphorylase [Candidatus Omnitrophica bacterium]|nr:carboxylating nicotinate-nucleotide diphosphorylase [Candidatus Omnitrophota bacterium]
MGKKKALSFPRKRESSDLDVSKKQRHWIPAFAGMTETGMTAKNIRQALREDIGTGDITTRLIVPKDWDMKAQLVVREACVLAGLFLLPKIFKILDSTVRVKLLKKDASAAEAGERVAVISGPARSILAGERVAVNYLAHLSGIATLTHEFVKRVRPYPVEILATRKTTPGLRVFEKYAVECGGGHAHRQGLYDQYMLKDNHKEAMRLMGHRLDRQAARRMRQKRDKSRPFIVEVDAIREIPWALSFRPSVILLDNFSLPDIRKAVVWVNRLCKADSVTRPLVEASGGVKLKRVREIAQTGVDRISVGAITHSAPTIDFSLEVT